MENVFFPALATWLRFVIKEKRAIFTVLSGGEGERHNGHACLHLYPTFLPSQKIHVVTHPAQSKAHTPELQQSNDLVTF